MAHTSHDRRPRSVRGLDEGLAGIGMAEVERPVDAGDHDRHRQVGWFCIALDPLLPQRCGVGAGVEQHLFDAQLACFFNPPHMHALAADTVFVHRRRLQHGDAETLASQRVRERGTGDASTDYQHVRNSHARPLDPETTRATVTEVDDTF
jgi:hypothetical protein